MEIENEDQEIIMTPTVSETTYAISIEAYYEHLSRYFSIRPTYLSVTARDMLLYTPVTLFVRPR